MNRLPTESRIVRADQLCLGDVIVETNYFDEDRVTKTLVDSLSLVGDDVEINSGRISTSVGNVFRVERTVRPVDPNRLSG